MEIEVQQQPSFFARLIQKIESRISDWLLYEEANFNAPLQDFEKMCRELKPADTLLFEGRARVSRAISVVTQSQWTHAALYIGRATDFAKDAELKAIVAQYFDGDAHEPLVVESLLGQGMVITPLTSYAHEHIRLCRPRGILPEDAALVVKFAMRQAGRSYDVRQLFDLARFIFPYTFLPRRWLSSLFNYKPGSATKAVCSTVLAEAFESVKFPILPIVRGHKEKAISISKRNPRLFTQRDFDQSPYFGIYKFPYINYDQSFLGISRDGGYRELPWEPDENLYCNDDEECYVPDISADDQGSIQAKLKHVISTSIDKKSKKDETNDGVQP